MKRLGETIGLLTLTAFLFTACGDDGTSAPTGDGGGTMADTGAEADTGSKGDSASATCGLTVPATSAIVQSSGITLCNTSCALSLGGPCTAATGGERLINFDWDDATVMGSQGFHLKLHVADDEFVEASSGGETSTPAKASLAGKVMEETMMGARGCDADTTKCNLVTQMPKEQEVTVKTKKYELTFTLAVSASKDFEGTITISSFKTL